MIRPITDRTIGAYMTHVDMDRIAKNLNELAITMNSRGYLIPSGLKTGYSRWDILTKSEWTKVYGTADAISRAIDNMPTVGDNLGWDNLNAIESLTLEAYRALEREMHVVSDDGVDCGMDYEIDPVLEMHNAPKLPITIFEVCGDGYVSGDDWIGGQHEK